MIAMVLSNPELESIQPTRQAAPMDRSQIYRNLQEGLSDSFNCSEQGDYLRIRTPYLYPDGDNIDLFCHVHDDVVTVSDLAETTGWLRMQSVASHRSREQSALIKDACVIYDVQFRRGMLQATCRPGNDLAEVVVRVAQAALQVSGLGHTFRTQTM